MNERRIMAVIVLSELIAAKPEAIDDPIMMGELINKAFKIADDMGAIGGKET